MLEITNTDQKISMLRMKLAQYRLDGYIILSSDPHNSEYLPDEYKERQWLTGFTGSNGIAVVTYNHALLWTDGRYFIQAENQIKNSEFKLMKMNTPGYPDVCEFLKMTLPTGRRIAINSKTTSQKVFKEYKENLAKKDIELCDGYDLISEMWQDRPQAPEEPGFVLDVKYAGKTPEEKLTELRKKMHDLKVNTLILSSLDDICWLYNIRGYDIKNNPVVTSYAVVDLKNAYLFIDYNKLSIEMNEHLKQNGIDEMPYEDIFGFVNTLQNRKIILDDSKTSRELYKMIGASNKILIHRDLTTDMKAIKNSTEIENLKNAWIKDATCVTRFIYWLKKHKDISTEDEISATEKLESLRKEKDLYIEPSFDTISAYGENAAMMHYSATKKNKKNLKPEGFLLVDSGGQYLDGTTDITRTIALGDLTEEQKKDFTLVLKSHLDLLGTVFLEGTTGHALDAIARRPIWKNMMDYKCGTGHGVGFLLGVHEGPHRISTAYNDVDLKPGMVVTIEPGIYKENKHGIRLENVVLVVDAGETSDGKFYKFEPLSYAPIDVDAIIPEMLTQEEKDLFNEYQNLVYKNIVNHVPPKEKAWLKEVTKNI